MDSATQAQTHKQRKAAGQALSQLLGHTRLHVRAADRDRLTSVTFLGSAYDLHGPVGCCVCCHGGDTKRGHRIVRHV